MNWLTPYWVVTIITLQLWAYYFIERYRKQGYLNMETFSGWVITVAIVVYSAVLALLWPVLLVVFVFLFVVALRQLIISRIERNRMLEEKGNE